MPTGHALHLKNNNNNSAITITTNAKFPMSDVCYEKENGDKYHLYFRPAMTF